MANKLTPRQHALRNFLDNNFEGGKYFSIEEICNAGLGYELNTNPKSHDKCIALSNDVKAINWCITERYKIIIKNKKGGVKLCESEAEFNEWRDAEMKKVERKYQYLNTLKYKEQRDGTTPFINQAGRVLDIDEIKPVEVFKN